MGSGLLTPSVAFSKRYFRIFSSLLGIFGILSFRDIDPWSRSTRYTS